MFWECVVAVCINSHYVDHNGQLRDAPPHYQSSNAKMFLEGSAECNKATYEEWNWDIACPVTCEKSASSITKIPLPKTAFSFEDTVVSLDGKIHDVVVDIPANQFPHNYWHLMAT